VKPRTADVEIDAAPARLSALIPQRLLVASGPFARGLPATVVAEAIARGLNAGGRPAADLCPIDAANASGDVAGVLEALAFDARMLSSRAVIIADAHLEQRTLAGSVTFEIATRARQRGVPAYAVTGLNELNAFDARILDLQVVLEADGVDALVAAGRELALLV
jgi:hypothetical protein